MSNENRNVGSVIKIVLWIVILIIIIPRLVNFGSDIIEYRKESVQVEDIEKEVRDVYKKEYRSLIIVNNLSSETKLQKVKLFTSDGVIITSKDLSLRNEEDNIVLANFDKKKLFKDINNLKLVLESDSSEYEKIFETKTIGVTVIEISEADIRKKVSSEIPNDINENVKSNVVNTDDQETTSLREVYKQILGD